MTAVFFVLAIALLLFTGWSIRKRMRRSALRNRLIFGFDIPEAPAEEINLSAGDYGLEGSARLVYYLTRFSSSPAGYAGLFGIGAVIGVLLKLTFNLKHFSTPMIALLSGALLLMLSNLYISKQRKERSRKTRYELPNALQSIVAVMESGLAFESALQHIVRESGTQHPLYFDLQVMLDAMQQGRRRGEALKLWASRANERTVTDVVAAMIQADQTGAALGGVLRHHAETQLKEIEAELLKRAEKIPIYMIMPMMLCILPPIFLVAVGPSMLRIVRMFEAIMSNA